MDFNQFKYYSNSEKIQLLDNWKKSTEIDNLIMSLEDDSFEVSSRASELLVSLGKPVVEKLIEATHSGNKEIRNWAILTLEQIEFVGFSNIWLLLKLAITDPNDVIRAKAYQGAVRSIKTSLKPIQKSFEMLFYFIIITIVQMVALVLLLLPILLSISKVVPVNYINLADTISSFILAAFIPIISGIVIANIMQIKEENYFFAGLFGIIQNIPYNFFLALLINKPSIINSLVPAFGLIGGMIGHHYFINEIKKQESQALAPFTSVAEEQRRTLFLIRQRLRLSKRFQDSIIAISAIIGFILLIYISIQIYNISSVPEIKFNNEVVSPSNNP